MLQCRHRAGSVAPRSCLPIAPLPAAVRSHSSSTSLQTSPPPQSCSRLCEHTGYPGRPRSHTHNPWVSGGTKELLGAGCGAEPALLPLPPFFLTADDLRFSLLIPPFNPLHLSLPGSGHFLVSPGSPILALVVDPSRDVSSPTHHTMMSRCFLASQSHRLVLPSVTRARVEHPKELWGSGRTS